MATFTPTTRTKHEYNSVYIRISHNSSTDYIKTSMILHKSGLKKGKIADFTIISNCAGIIKGYIKKINDLNIDSWTVKELKNFLIEENDNISFSEFALKLIEKMELSGRKKPADNYTTALNSLENFFGRKIFFNDITSKNINSWLDTLQHTARAKQMYPVIIKKIFTEGCMEFNDYERNIIKISHQPFIAVNIPKADLAKERYVSVEDIRKLFAISPESQREKLAHDCAKVVICLAGINTIDLYNLEKANLNGDKLCYNRTKEKDIRPDKAYIEITIPEPIKSILKQYNGKNHLFNFKDRYSDPDNFSKAINTGLRSLCKKAGIEPITCYFLRHSWATFALNECGATMEEVAFSLNHASAHKVTQRYIKKDFTVIDRINNKVIDFISF